MNKTELIARLAGKQPHLTQRDARLAVDTILKLIQNGLKMDERIEIRGFGTFTRRYRPSRPRLDLSTGDLVISHAYLALHFRPAKELRLRVDAFTDNT